MARSAQPVKTGLTFKQYLEFEKSAKEKHEFVDGQLFLMAGASDRHNRLSGWLYAQFLSTEVPPCRAFIADMKVQTPSGQGYYPDVLVVCDEDDAHPYAKKKPCLIIEVLSESTEAIDRGEKLNNYRQFESLQAYLLVNQNAKRLELFRRDQDDSLRYEVFEEGDTLSLPRTDTTIAVDDLYKNL